MQVIKRNNRLIAEEKETLLNFDYITKTWYAYTTVLSHYNKFVKQGWTQTDKYIYADDGSVFGGQFEAPARAVTFRNTEKKQMSKKQLMNLDGGEDEE